MERYYSVDQIAEMLSMHPKTIQRYIREGKLKANKVGKSWRVAGHDLSIFTENTSLEEHRSPERAENKISTSCVVDIMISSKEEGLRIVNLLTAALNCKQSEYGKSTMHTQYLEYESKVRVTLWGHLLFMQRMLELIAVVTGEYSQEKMEEKQ